MADVAPLLQNVPLPGAQYRAAVSEFLAQVLAGSVNFNNYFNYAQKAFFLNGDYSRAAVPFTGVDGMAVFEFDAQIIDVWMYGLIAGSSGTTELDIQIATAPGAGFSSIFTTTPKISYQAGNDVWVGAVNPSLIGPSYAPSPSYTPPANTTQPVLNATITNVVPRWSAIKCNLLDQQVGGQNCGLIIHYRNINTL